MASPTNTNSVPETNRDPADTLAAESAARLTRNTLEPTVATAPVRTAVIDESMLVDTAADTTPTQPVHPMPEHFPEVQLDGTGNVTIKGPAVVVAAPATSEPVKVVSAAPVTPVVATAPPKPTVKPALKTAVVTATPADAVTPAPSPARRAAYQAERNVCIRCGSTNMARGYVVDFSTKFTHIHFAPKRMSPRRLNSLWAVRPFRSLAQLDALACRDCGAVLLTLDPGELRRVERNRQE